MQYGIGQPVRRREDVRLVTGRGAFTDDLNFERQAYAVFVRSPHAHARILDVEISAAVKAPGVIGVLTAKDLAGIGTMPLAAQIRSRDGSLLRTTPKTLLAGDRARFCGEAVAVVVAESLEAAKDGAELVEVPYDPLPAVPSVDGADSGALVWDHIPRNLSFDWIDGNEAACAASFARAARVITVKVVQNRVMPCPMETRGAVALHDAESGRYTLYTGTQGPVTVRDRIASLLGISKENLRLVTTDVGGGFGQKISVSVEQPVLLLAAAKFGRPVKWIAERAEASLADAHGRDSIAVGELALDAEARILGLRATVSANLGAYLSQAGPNIATSGGLRILGGVYRVPVAFVNVKGYITNTAPITAYRGAGRPEAAYLMERLLDHAADAFGVDRPEIRRRNLLDPEELPYRNWKGLTFDSGAFAENMQRCVTEADWDGFAARQKLSAARGQKRGQGIGYYVEASGGPAGREPAVVRFDPDGNVRVLLGTQASGQGHETSFAQVASAALGVPFETVTIVEGDTDMGVAGLNSVGSRSLQTAGSAICHAAAEIIAKGKAAAAHVLQAGGAAVTFAIKDGIGRFTVSGTERAITMRALAAALTREMLGGFEHGLDTESGHDGIPTFPNGCHICEVEIDPETGTVAVDRYVIVDDLGRIINPLLVAGQVHGGLAQGLGQVLMEHAVYDPESGQLVTATFNDYAIPRAADMPRDISLSFNEVPCATNPLGSKGAGEAGTVGALPALIGAIADALEVPHFDMPATPERVWRAMKQKRVANSE
jgi:carbon-monoxide dehydrogenase large subunit